LNFGDNLIGLTRCEAKNVEKLLGKYVSVTRMHVPHEKGSFYDSVGKKGAPPVKPGSTLLVSRKRCRELHQFRHRE
jgi:hypothetical protein